MLDNHTWDLVSRPPDTNVVTGKWLFRHKLTLDGSLDRYGSFGASPSAPKWTTTRPSSMSSSLPPFESSSPSLSLGTGRPINSTSRISSSTTLYGDCLLQPAHRLRRRRSSGSSLPTELLQYGLKQAPRAWYRSLRLILGLHRFAEAKSDMSLFIYRRGNDTIYLLLYVDDMLTASTTDLLQCTIITLQREFVMKDLGPLHHFLGITVERRSQGLFLHQRQYTTNILERAGMSDCKPCSTLVDTHAKISEDDGPPVADAMSYRNLTGALQY
jgi:hypothetical protein